MGLGKELSPRADVDGTNQLKRAPRNGKQSPYKYDGDGLMREKITDQSRTLIGQQQKSSITIHLTKLYNMRGKYLLLLLTVHEMF
ncbi:hypothetical protein QW71_01235 [Paenibacillus sp. IHB B 3415]|nr:hypothetical protein QW71_01235 [Paenibacillus sp. IHB B 3415]